MRVGEAIRLDRDDIDLAHGVLTVRDTKFGKSRELPIHPSTRHSVVRLHPRARPALPRPDHPGGADLPSRNSAALLRRARHVQAVARPRRAQAALGDLPPPDSRLQAPVRCADAARLVSVRGRCAAADAAAVHISRAHPTERQLFSAGNPPATAGPWAPATTDGVGAAPALPLKQPRPTSSRRARFHEHGAVSPGVMACARCSCSRP